MERGVAAAAAERAQAVDYGLRIVAQEQVGLAYAGWDRLLTRVALPAWRMGRWPSRLDAGVVAALTELSRRDRLAEGFASRLGERPACDLLEEPGAVDEAASLLAARLFHGGPAEPGPDWSPVDWQRVSGGGRRPQVAHDAARLHRVLDALGVRRHPPPRRPHPAGPRRPRPCARVTAPPDRPAPCRRPGRATLAGTRRARHVPHRRRARRHGRLRSGATRPRLTASRGPDPGDPTPTASWPRTIDPDDDDDDAEPATTRRCTRRPAERRAGA